MKAHRRPVLGGVPPIDQLFSALICTAPGARARLSRRSLRIQGREEYDPRAQRGFREGKSLEAPPGSGGKRP